MQDENNNKIKNLTDFLTKCYSENTNNKNVLFFRGENEKHPSIIPSIYRPNYKYIENENNIFKEIISKFPDEMLQQKTTVEKLILMQHFELPTRLLDISKNPLVALFFACYGNKDKDGRVYIFSVPEDEIKFCDSDTVSVVANICKRPITFSLVGTEKISRTEFNENEEISYLLHEIKEEKPYFQNLVKREHINSTVCLRPRMNNPRILRQDGYFLLFGINESKSHCSKIKEKWMLNSIEIPKESKSEIMEKLNFLNINESFLFPDYQHLATTFQKKYKK